MRSILIAGCFVLAVASTGCAGGSGGSTIPSSEGGTARAISAGGVGGGGVLGGGGGGAAGGALAGGVNTCPVIGTTAATVPFPRIPPPTVTDDPCWFFYFPSDPTANITRPLAINFSGAQPTLQSSFAIGSHSLYIFDVYNTSKKSALTITSISVTGPNAADFQLDATSVATALKGVPVTHSPSFVPVQLTFTPSDVGPRSATLELVSNAGTQVIALTGSGAPAHPTISAPALAGLGGIMTFIDAPPIVSAPKLFNLANVGTTPLVISSASFGGANPGSFTLFARDGTTPLDPAAVLSGFTLNPQAMTPDMQIGLSPTAQQGDSATFIVNSNDPLQPTLITQLFATAR